MERIVLRSSDGATGTCDPARLDLPSFVTDEDTPRDFHERCLATLAGREPESKAFARINETGSRISHWLDAT